MISQGQYDTIIKQIEKIKLPDKCSCNRINKQINKILKNNTATIDIDEVCCPICCNCHFEKIDMEIYYNLKEL